MLLNFAGPICEGIDCIPFAVLAILYYALPIVVGGIILAVITSGCIKLLNKRRNTPIAKRSTRYIVGVVLFVAGAICFVMWQFPKSEYWHQKQFNKNSSIIKQRSILLPNTLKRVRTIVTVPLGDPITFTIESTLAESSREIRVKETNSISNLDNPPSHFRCGEFVDKQIKYCTNPTLPGAPSFYWVTVGSDGAGIEISFSKNFTETEEVNTIKSIETYPLKDLPDTTFTRSAY